MDTPSKAPPPFLGALVRALPAPPRSQRTLRYGGDDRAVTLSALSLPDREGVRALYELLTSFDATLRAVDAEADPLRRGERLAATFDLGAAIGVARSIGTMSQPSEEGRRALHDVRGGALTSLVMEVQRTRAGRGEDHARAMKTLTSDHLKVMRNALLELDDVRRASDLAPQEHSVERFAETLARVTGDGMHGAVEVSVDCSFRGGITMSCVELGALDRAALNILNNAVRHSAGSRVEVVLAPTGAQPGSDLRVCVANQIDPKDADSLHDRFGDALTRLFVEPFTTTGSGDGLKICLDFVASAYGIAEAAEVVEAGLVGATLESGWFVAWLCWPSVA